MNPRVNKDLELIVKTAINLAFNVSYSSAENLMAEAGVCQTIIDRILYDPNNVRETDLKVSEFLKLAGPEFLTNTPNPR